MTCAQQFQASVMKADSRSCGYLRLSRRDELLCFDTCCLDDEDLEDACLEFERLLLFEDALDFDDESGGGEEGLEGGRSDTWRVAFAWSDLTFLLPFPVDATGREGDEGMTIPFGDEPDSTGPVLERVCLASER